MTDTPKVLWLVVEEGSTAGAFAELGGMPVLLGRDPAAGLRMDPHLDRLVSARHARLDPADGGWVIRDLDSRNGTFVNGERLEGERRLAPGDRVQLGKGGPALRLTDRRPGTGEVLPDTRRTPRTREGFRPSLHRRRRLVVGGVGVAAVLALLVVWAVGAEPDPPAAGPQGEPGPTPGAPLPSAAAPDGEASLAENDTAAANRDAEIAALRERIRGMDQEIRRTRSESERLRDALREARQEGASAEEVEALQRQLQEANASLRRQQLAASIDYESIGRVVAPATALVYVEFEGNRVEAATAFGVDGRGRLVTNRHVVSREANDDRAVLRIGVQYAGRTEVLPARVAAISRSADLALLEIDTPDGELPAVSSFNASPDTLPAGAPVVLFGFPLGGSSEQTGPARPLVSSGVLMGRRGEYLEIEGYARGGASGSPILDADGQVIGVLAGGRTGEGGERLYAIPAPEIIRFLESSRSGSG